MDKLNHLASIGEPFLVISDYLAKNIEVYALDELEKNNIFFSFHQDSANCEYSNKIIKYPISFEKYKYKFDNVISQIKNGNTYLLNLTQPTNIKTNLDLETIYNCAKAPFKLYYKNQFISFSPERFIKIQNNTIHTYPMKGTIDASIKDAKNKILNNQKEMAEHVMIVDLLRNDLNLVAKNVKVNRFRYIDKIKAGDKNLLQVSSHIEGKLPDNWQYNFTNILKALLPAGSISGTPKKETLKIINNIEGYKRGFFSGIVGYFDGKNFDSAVLIRYIERQDKNLIYKSGGGITLDSKAEAEYQEMIDKIYLPI